MGQKIDRKTALVLIALAFGAGVLSAAVGYAVQGSRTEKEMTMPVALSLPNEILNDPASKEIVRVWANDNGPQTFVLRTDTWEDPLAWGLILVDLAHHVARAYAQSAGRNPDEALARIKEGFDAEWSSPTDAGYRQ